jgi:hypothetical protein
MRRYPRRGIGQNRKLARLERIPMIGYTGDVGGCVAAFPASIPGEPGAVASAGTVSCALGGPVEPGDPTVSAARANEPEPCRGRTNPTPAEAR